jgi:hypothetical protein
MDGLSIAWGCCAGRRLACACARALTRRSTTECATLLRPSGPLAAPAAAGGGGSARAAPGRGVFRFQQAEIGIEIVNDITVGNGHIKNEIKMLNASIWEHRRLGGGSSTLIDGRQADVAIFIHRIQHTKMIVFGALGQFAAHIVPYCIWKRRGSAIMGNGSFRLNVSFEMEIQ